MLFLFLCAGMKGSDAFSSLFSQKKTGGGGVSANDLFTRSNGAVGHRM
jgi:hypothetical protein